MGRRKGEKAIVPFLSCILSLRFSFSRMFCIFAAGLED